MFLNKRKIQFGRTIKQTNLRSFNEKKRRKVMILNLIFGKSEDSEIFWTQIISKKGELLDTLRKFYVH